MTEAEQRHLVIAAGPMEAIERVAMDVYGVPFSSAFLGAQVTAAPIGDDTDIAVGADEIADVLDIYGDLPGLRVRIRAGDLACREHGTLHSSVW